MLLNIMHQYKWIQKSKGGGQPYTDSAPNKAIQIPKTFTDRRK